MSKEYEVIMPAHLRQSPNTNRWYVTVKSWITNTVTTNSGRVLETIAPKADRRVSELADDAITSVLLPEECNDWTREDMIAELGDTFSINTATGELLLG